MRFKKLININAALFLVLFLVFFSYRLYFWGEPSKQIYQVLLNALGDAILSYTAGYFIFKIKIGYQNNKWALYSFSSFILLGGIALVYLYHVFIYKAFSMFKTDFIPFFNSVCFQLLDSVAIIITGAFGVVIDKMQFEKKQISTRLADLNQEKLFTELKYLKAQIDPHFIFNSLNTIFYQIKDEDNEAKESVTQFSDILRYHMQSSSQQEVSLNEEMKYIQSYIEFQSKRSKDFLVIKSKFELEENNFQIEPLLLMPLIENAFKYVCPEGIQHGWIDILAKFKANRFEFSIKNSYPLEWIKQNTGAGIGLQNVLKRLEILYQNRHHFEINNMNQQGIYTCNLTLWK
ncbi:MAG: sensor histidine kinase [Bacteroidia bacterium]